MPAPRARPVQTVMWAVLLTLATACGSDSGDGGQGPPPPPPPSDPTVVSVTGEFADHLAVAGGRLYWSERSETPLMSAPASGGTPTPVAMKIGSPDGVLLSGADLIWLDDRNGSSPHGCAGDGVWRVLRRTSGSSSTTLAEGDQCYQSTGDLVLGGGAVFWVSATGIPGEEIRRTTLPGGTTTTVRGAGVPVVALAGDAQYLYWLEDDYANPVAAVRRMPFAGGPVETLVEGLLMQAQTFAINSSLAFFDAIEDQGVERLFAVPLTGGTPVPLTTVTAQPVKLAADETTLYWVDAAELHAVPVGGGQAATLAAISGQPFDLLVRETDVVWSEGVSPALDESGRVRHVAKAGGAAATLADGEDAPRRLMADATWLYWTEGGSFGLSEGFGRIARAPASGGAGATIVSGIVSDTPIFTVSGDWLVVAERGRIKRVPRGGGTVETVAAGSGAFPVSVASDGSYAYWVEDPVGITRRAPLAGGASVVIGDPVNHQGAGGPLALVGGMVVWAPRSDALMAVSATGGTPTLLASSLAFVSDMLADQDAAYVGEQDSGRLLRVPLAGGAPTVLGSLQGASWQRLAQDATTIYSIDQAHLQKVPKAGGSVTPLFDVLGQMEALLPASIAVDGESVYWTVPAVQVILRLPK